VDTAEPMDLVALGDHVAARAAIAAIGDDEAATQAAQGSANEALAAMNADVGAVRIFAATALLLLVIGMAAVVPHPSVASARRLVAAVSEADEPAAIAEFSETGWESAGSQLFSEMRGRTGRVFARSTRAKEASFVLAVFGDASARRYLRFDATSWKIDGVDRRRPPKPQPTPPHTGSP